MIKNLKKDDNFYINNKKSKVVELQGNHLKALGSKGEYIVKIHNVNQNRSTGEFRGSIVKLSVKEIK